VVIVGGGLAGLTTAWRLGMRAEITVIDARSRFGGQIFTEHDGQFIVERGAEGFVFRSEALPRLASEVDLHEELIGQTVMQSYGFDGRQLSVLRAGEAAAFLGFQVPAADLGKGIRTFRRGMGSLVQALQTRLAERVALRLGQSVSEVESRPNGVQVVLQGGAAITADAVVVATDARGASHVLQSTLPGARSLFAAPCQSSVAVELAFVRSAIDHPLDGTGFVVAEDAQREGLRACTFTNAKFVERSPGDHALLRLFFRSTDEEVDGPHALDDTAWRDRALAGLRRVIAVAAEPRAWWVSRWPRALPVFNEARRAAVTELESSLVGTRIRLAGSAFHGAGIDAAVRSGEHAAEQILEL